MLKQLRTNTKWIMILVVIGFVAMIVFEWGMNISSRRQGVEAGIIASINGEDIEYTYYDQLVRNQTQSLASNQRLTLDQLRSIHNDVWNYIVTNTLINQEIERRDITYTDEEMLQYILNNPIQFADQISLFLENGQFSIERYRQFIQDPQNLNNPQTRQILDYIEAEAQAMMPTVKLQEDLMGGVVVTDSDVREQWLRENDTRSIEFVNVGALELRMLANPDGEQAVSDYYETHREDYSRPERRSIEAILFLLAPTAADTAMIREQAAMLAERARNGEDFAELADAYSEDPGNTLQGGMKRGGDLGLFTRGQMVQPFEEAAFGLDAGQISDPIETQYGVHVIKVDSLVTAEDTGEVTQVSARHILLNFEPSGETQQTVEEQVRTFHETVSAGADFHMTAEQDSLRVQDSPLFAKDSGYVPNIGANTEILMNRIFNAEAGEVLPIYQTDNGYYIIKVTEVAPSDTPPLDNVLTAATDAYMKDIRKAYALEYVTALDEQVGQGMTITEALEAVNDTLVYATAQVMDINRLTSFGGLGRLNPITAAVFELDEPGTSTGPVETEEGYGLAVLNEILPLDETQFEVRKTTIRNQLLTERQNAIMTTFLESLRENAEIVDNRDVFLSL